MKILVTGAAGYIGSILVPALLSHNRDYRHRVTALDLFPHGIKPLAACCHDPYFTPVNGDVRDEALMTRLMKDADIIINLAAIVGAPHCKRDPHAAESINRDAVKMLVRFASKQQMVLFPTTNSGYGVGEQDAFCTEETPLRPLSLYGVTKCDAEKIILDSGNGISFRLATAFGMSPAMRTSLLVNDMVYRAVMDRAVIIFEGHFRRNYIHVRDVAKAFLHGIDNYAAMNGQSYNVGLSSANLTKLQLCEKIKQYAPSFVYLEAPIGEDPDKRDYVVSNQKLEDAGWTPDYSLDDGVQELIKGYAMCGP